MEKNYTMSTLITKKKARITVLMLDKKISGKGI